jgi:phosphoribosyl 1,2-cyclic phosphodiesterase
MKQTITFWGVRGSIASPGESTNLVGGNTSCVEVRLGHQRIIIDGGTGLRQLGLAQRNDPLEAHLLLGHLHWDHIQGIPFCGPLFHPQSAVTLLGPDGLQDALERQMSTPTFPVSLSALRGIKEITSITAGATFLLGEVSMTTTRLNHPGGGLGYRLTHGTRSVVYLCDTEHPASGLDQELVAFAHDADLLIYDAQYLPEEYSTKQGWGHSTFAAGATLAQASKVSALLLTHHDPTRDDLAVARVERRAQQLFPAARMAREGLVLELERLPSRGGAENGADALVRVWQGA